MVRLIARRVAVLVGGLLLAAGIPSALEAQRPISLGQMVEATLTSTDSKIDGRGAFHTYRFEAKADTRYIITMRSSSVDAYVWVARAVGPLTENLGSDDDGGGGTDSRLRFRSPAAGSYIVVAQSLSADGAGAYTLLVEEAPPVQPAVARTIVVGETMTGRIDDSSPMLEDMEDTPYALYRLTATGGRRLRVTMASADFDAYLTIRRVTGSGEVEVASDDDSGGGTDARITFVADGEYTIVARPLGSSGSGSYSLSVAEAPATVIITRGIRVGDTAEGEITDADPELDSGPYFHQFEIEAQRGERIRLTLRSDDFDSFLRWGRAGETGFQEISSDDDSGGNVDSMLEVTVPESGKYVIRVSPLSAGQTGKYRLLVERL